VVAALARSTGILPAPIAGTALAQDPEGA
jgi:hypothetical protein